MHRKWWTLLVVCVATFMLLLDITIVNVALPSIQKSLGASFQDLQWVVDAYALTLAALLLTAGSLADLLGRKRVFLLGIGVFTLASLLCGLSTTPLMLNLARGFQGVGGAIMFACSLALLAQEFQGRERGTAYGVWGAAISAAAAVGPLMGGGLAGGLGWEYILGYSPLQTGVRFIPVTGIGLVLAPLAGRAASRGSPRWFLGVGLALVAAGLFLMHGVAANSTWTVLLPGLILAGAGVGIANPVLAQVAVGVVPPARSGMASGINNTCRQVGIATGIAGLGAVFQHQVQTKAAQLHSHAPQAAKEAFASGLNEILIVGGIVAAVGAGLALLLVRQADMAEGAARAGAAAPA